MVKVLVFICTLVMFCPPVMAQDTIPKEQLNNWIIKLTDYRSYLLRKNPKATMELKVRLDKWNETGASKKEQQDFALNVVKVSVVNQQSMKRISKEVEKYIPNSKILPTFCEADYTILNENSELLNLVFLGVLNDRYPFSINSKTSFFTEFNAYDISPTDRIGEIGAGTGTFSLMLNKLEPKAEIFVNELWISFLEYVEMVAEEQAAFYDLSKMKLVKGRVKSTKMEGFGLDKIIIRNTFHHFTKPEKMLSSIKQSLNENGVLYILETMDFLTTVDTEILKSCSIFRC
ncbi:MAG: class I SAM-dependent methyltransferase [Saprospiraceae bacterium]